MNVIIFEKWMLHEAHFGALPIHLHIPEQPDEGNTSIPTIVNSAILALKLNKTPVVDGVPAELLKAGQTTLTSRMHQLIQKLSIEEHLPKD